MQYTLMHKNIAVADMELDEATSSIQRIDAVYRPEHLPVATASKRDGVDRAALNAWWIDRCIPASRKLNIGTLTHPRCPRCTAVRSG